LSYVTFKRETAIPRFHGIHIRGKPCNTAVQTSTPSSPFSHTNAKFILVVTLINVRSQIRLARVMLVENIVIPGSLIRWCNGDSSLSTYA